MLKNNPINFDVESHKNIFNLIFRHKKISAASLARITGMQKSSILYITRALEDRKLIRVHTKAFKTKERGRPSTLYEVNPELFSILGVEVIPGEMRILITDLQGQILKKESSKFNFTDAEDFSIKIKEQLKTWDIPEDKILGIGVAVPGLVDMENGTLISSKPLDIHSYPIQDEIQKYFKTSVLVCNDAKAGVSGTYLLSNLKKLEWENILFYAISLHFSGIGMGIIFNGKQYFGSSGQSGEIYNSFPTIANLCKEFGVKEEDFYNSDENEVTPELDKIFNKLKNIIGQLIVDTSQLLNPDYFEIGGDVTSYNTFFNNYLVPEIKKIQEKQYSSKYEAPAFNSSKYGEYSNTLGAAASILQSVIC